MSQHDEQPVIRIVKKIQGHGHHGGAWKVAYADFVTAMMALFIVLWILTQSEDVKRGIGGYFRDPTGKALLGAGPRDASSQMTVSMSKSPATTMVPTSAQAVRALEQEAENLRDIIEESPELQALKEQISVEVSAEGVRVEINDSEKRPLFETGSAKLSPELIAALGVLAEEYQKLPNPLVIEGHTDSQQYGAESAMTNWELATQRANETRYVMEHHGLSAEKIYMIRGFAERRPRFTDPGDPRNRRISMLLLSEEGKRIAEGQSAPIPSKAAQPNPAAVVPGPGQRVSIGSISRANSGQ